MGRGRLIVSIVLWLLLIFFVMGAIRYGIQGQAIIGSIVCDPNDSADCEIVWGSFVLPASEIIARASDAHMEAPWLDFGEWLTSTEVDVITSFGLISDIFSFFNAIGSLLQFLIVPIKAVGAFFETIGLFFGWFFGLFINP